jgi:hypothetical protein
MGKGFVARSLASPRPLAKTGLREDEKPGYGPAFVRVQRGRLIATVPRT